MNPSHGAAVEVTDVEKNAYETKVEPVASDHDGEVQTGSTQVLAKKLKSRHMQMIAVGTLLSDHSHCNIEQELIRIHRWLHRCRSLCRFR